jgi:hypothetical protein
VKFTLEIHNRQEAEFGDDYREVEIARILRELAERLQTERFMTPTGQQALNDSHGEAVGWFEFSEPETAG